jgi:serine-type D-Ala-D-Ala carboxypeptidase/endopeptidase (penicillin-binding protein 4)
LRYLSVAASGILVSCAGAPLSAPTPAPAPVPASVGAPAVAANTPTVAVRARSPVQATVDSLLALPQLSNSQWGVLIVAPDRRDTLASVNADRLLMPASNQKIVTGAVGVSQLGPDFSWSTSFVRTGPIVAGVLRGDIIVSGTGDPSISASMRTDPLVAFDPLVIALRGAGVRRIAGRILASETPAFPGSPHGFGWDWDDLDGAYGAGVTELMFNEGFATITVRGCAAAGKPACISTGPLTTAPILRSTIVTRAANTSSPSIEWWRDSAATPGITMRGSVAAGASIQIDVAQPDLRATYLAAVREALQREGIRVGGARIPGANRRDTVVVLQSRPFASVLAAMQKPSQNQIAEAVFRTLAHRATGVGTPDSARAVIERQLTAWGVRSDAYAVRDGSGLSRHDYITPRALVQILDTIRRGPNGRLFFESLPIGGVDGTLKSRLTAIAGRVHAKTGTIDKARALSGYLVTDDGETLIFSIIANNFTVPTREVDRVVEVMLMQLVALRQSRP